MIKKCCKRAIGFVASIIRDVLSPKIMLHNGLQAIENGSIFRIDDIIILSNGHPIIVNEFVVLQKEARSKTQNTYDNDFDKLKSMNRQTLFFFFIEKKSLTFKLPDMYLWIRACSK